MELNIWTVSFPYDTEAFFIVDKFRTEFPTSDLPTKVTRWPNFMTDFIVDLNRIINIDNVKGREELRRVQELHNNNRLELLKRMLLLLQDKEENLDFASREANALRNLEEYDEKSRRNFFRRQCYRLKRALGGKMFRFQEKMKKIEKNQQQENTRQNVSFDQNDIEKTDYGRETIQNYF